MAKLDPEQKARNKNLVTVFKYLIPLVKGRLLRNMRTVASQDKQQLEEFEKILNYLEFYTRENSPPIPGRVATEVKDFWELHQNPVFRHWSLKQNGVMETQDKSMLIFLTNTLDF